MQYRRYAQSHRDHHYIESAYRMRQVQKRAALLYKGHSTSESDVHLLRIAVLSHAATMLASHMGCSVRQSSTIAGMRTSRIGCQSWADEEELALNRTVTLCDAEDGLL